MRQQPFASPGEALSHYGVKGMRWGVRKEEETSSRDGAKPEAGSFRVAKPSTAIPGKAAVSSTVPTAVPALSEKAQARVDKFMKRSDIANTQIAELRRRNEELLGSKSPGKAYEQYANNETIKQYQASQKRALKDAEAVKKGKLTSTQKKLIIGGVAVAGVLAYGAVVKGQQSGALNSWQTLAEARLRGQKVPFNMNKELSGKMSAADLLAKVVKPVNPGYNSPGGHMNCRRSTFAYELRRRGFDVHATTSAVGWGQSESGVINAVTPGSRNFYRSLSLSSTVQQFGETRKAAGDTRVRPMAKLVLDKLDEGSSISSGSKKVFATLAKEPEGSRGEVLFRFPNFGHSMAYEIVNGKPHVFDSQKGTFHDLTKTVESKWGLFHGAEITRLDNVDLDLNFLTRWADNN